MLKINRWLGLAMAWVALTWASVSAATTSKPEVTVTPFLQSVQIGNEPFKSFDISYTNDSTRDLSLSLSVVDFGSLDQSGGVAFVGQQFSQLLDKYTLSHWLLLSNDRLDIAAHQTEHVTATIANNSDLGPGGHYAAVVAGVENSGNNKTNQISLKQKLTSLILATKTGGEKYDLRLNSLDSNGNLVHLPTEAQVTFKATGNTHVVPRGIVYLKDSAGRVLAKGAINQESGFVLPDTTRTFTVRLDKLAAPKLWQTSYKLQVDYRYDGLNVYASKSASLRSFSPWLLVAIIALAGVITLASKSRKH